jgi:alpha,alpha-trehalase
LSDINYSSHLKGNWAQTVLDYPELLAILRAHFRGVDEKLAVDVVPKKPLAQINREIKQAVGSDLARYIEENFDYQRDQNQQVVAETGSVVQYIEKWYEKMQFKQIALAQSTLIQLPHPYIKAGGRFEESYYWDSYFIALGLDALGKTAQVEDLTRNMAHQVETLGFIPNANRLYYLDRSQPPVFALMLKLNRAEVTSELLPALEKELNWWYTHRQKSHAPGQLAYYSSSQKTARAESYTADITTSSTIPDAQKPNLFMHLRAAAESGWDFSSRWLQVADDLRTIHTSDLFAVDLNCLLYLAEEFLAESELKLHEQSEYHTRATQRAQMINELLWNEQLGVYTDFNFVLDQQSTSSTLATVFPLFAKIAPPSRAVRVAKFLEDNLLQPGGLMTTTVLSGQQWDAPNGWAPLQWIAIKALRNYQLDELAAEIARRWTKTCLDTYERTGKLFEKYDVQDPMKTATGGEYQVQDGFGWTNGVYLDLYLDLVRSRHEK